MLSMLKDYKGKVVINDTEYRNINDAVKHFKRAGDTVTIKLLSNSEKRSTAQNNAKLEHILKKITVKQYMTRKATDDFDFMREWNNDEPMPLRTMIGTVEKETRGMVYMKLHGDITEEKTLHCLKCGRPITNTVIQDL